MESFRSSTADELSLIELPQFVRREPGFGPESHGRPRDPISYPTGALLSSAGPSSRSTSITSEPPSFRNYYNGISAEVKSLTTKPKS